MYTNKELDNLTKQQLQTLLRANDVPFVKSATKLDLIISARRIPQDKRISPFADVRKYGTNKNDVMVEVRDIHKKYGKNHVLKGISFDVREGEKIAIVGPNGMGKSTLTEIIAQIKIPTSGTVKFSFGTSKADISKNIGIQFQDSRYPFFVKTKDIIKFFIDVSGSSIDESEVIKLKKLLHIDENIEKQDAAGLSGGQQQRLNVLLALIHNPKLLILDELSTGLDIESKAEVKQYVKDYIKKTKSATLILVSHNVDEIKFLCDRMIIIHEGLIYEDVSVREAIKKNGSLTKYLEKLFLVDFIKMKRANEALEAETKSGRWGRKGN